MLILLFVRPVFYITLNCPDGPGIDDFKSAKFHTAQWDHKVNISEATRVGVICTGSRAAQAISELIKAGAKVCVLQRIPQWIMHLSNFNFSITMQKLMTRYPVMTKMHHNAGKFFLEHILSKQSQGT
ncbi:hypothetical protein [Colwellia sp. MB02u-6]|uniref:hypothetical protein n=1 Tax=Colwellia sp. MB02u-6 TaxID=2759824 RepID=UPI002174ECFE|nr:hypothetical protein [Colwellia sp. MB02u-6]